MIEVVLEPIEGALASTRHRWLDDFKLRVVAEYLRIGVELGERISKTSCPLGQMRAQLICVNTTCLSNC